MRSWWAVALLLIGLQTVASPDGQAFQTEGMGIILSTDKTVYAPGEVISIRMTLFNHTEKEMVLHFNTGQRYDFSIEDEAGKVLWRWSEGRMFAMVLGMEVLGPRKKDMVYTETYRGNLEPGYYKITGSLIAEDKPVSGSVIIKIE